MTLDEFLNSENLPSLSPAAVQIVRCANDPESIILELADIIRNNEPMSGRLIELANAGQIQQNRAVTSIEQAVLLLGMSRVSSASVAISLNQHVDRDVTARDEIAVYWKSTMLQATAAELLADGNPHDAGEFFLAGLLADVGQRALLLYDRHKYTALGQQARDESRRLVDLERDRYGFTHVDISCHLANAWELPDSVVEAIEYQHAVVSDLLDCESESISKTAAACFVASHVADLFMDAATENAVVAIDGVAGRFFSINTQQILHQTRVRLGQVGKVFRVDADSLPAVADIMANANRRLTKMLTNIMNREDHDDDSEVVAG